VGEHLGRYQTDGEIMARAGYIQAAYDQRGFGLSEGRRGHTPSYDAYFDDIELFLSQASGRYSGLPVFLYGMSMGAMLVLAFTPVRKPAVQGVIAAAPGLKTALEKQKVKVLLAKILGKALPKLALDSVLTRRNFAVISR
jgi:alpha-beta hydrolase superfamily lysophospholipase